MNFSMPARYRGDMTATVLVVDDDPFVRTLVVIILDLRMPGPVDGEQLLFTLRDQGNDVPVIVVSGWVDEEVTKQAPDCVHAVLKKPIRVDDFAQTVADVLS